MNHNNIPYIESIIEQSWKDKEYIRCKNLVNYVIYNYPNNKTANIYQKKLNKIDFRREYMKIVRQFNSRWIVFALVEIVILYISLILTEMLFDLTRMEIFVNTWYIALFLIVYIITRIASWPIINYVDWKIILWLTIAINGYTKL